LPVRDFVSGGVSLNGTASRASKRHRWCASSREGCSILLREPGTPNARARLRQPMPEKKHRNRKGKAAKQYCILNVQCGSQSFRSRVRGITADGEARRGNRDGERIRRTRSVAARRSAHRECSAVDSRHTDSAASRTGCHETRPRFSKEPRTWLRIVFLERVASS